MDQSNLKGYRQDRRGASILRLNRRHVGRGCELLAQSSCSTRRDRPLLSQTARPECPSRQTAKNELGLPPVGEDSAAKANRHGWTSPLIPAHRNGRQTWRLPALPSAFASAYCRNGQLHRRRFPRGRNQRRFSVVFVRMFLYNLPVFINNNAMAEASSPFTSF